MEPLTSAWTELHTRVALLVAVVALGAGTGAFEQPPVVAWVGLAVVVAACGSLVLDRFGGAAVGLVVAALLVAARRASGAWGEDGFVLALVETVAVVLAGVAAGGVGRALREVVDAGAEQDVVAPAVEPVFGSLGLLDATTGMLRLEEEVERASGHGRPLTLLVLRIDITDEALDPAGRTAAQRAVARALEARLRDVEVPFALARDRLAAILPEADGARALERVAAVVDAVSTGRFAARAGGGDRLLAEVVEVVAGTARLGGDVRTADALLDAATVALERRVAASREGAARAAEDAAPEERR